MAPATRAGKSKKQKLEVENPAPEEDTKITYHFPELVLQRFFEVAGDVELAKNCRLVCKFWNRAACRYLREKGCIRLRESTRGLKRLKKLLTKQATGEIGDACANELPCPFRDIDVTVDRVTMQRHQSKDFLRFILNEDLNVTEFHAPFILAESITALCELLNRNKSTIKNLEMTFVRKQYLYFSIPVIQLEALNRFLVGDCCNSSCGHAQYIRGLLDHCDPQEIAVTVNGTGVVAAIFGVDFVCKPRLTSLKVNFDNHAFRQLASNFIPFQDFDSLGGIRSNLKLQILEISARDVSIDLARRVTPLLRQVKDRLQRLTISALCLRDINFPLTCVKKLRIVQNQGYFPGFHSKKFPALESVEMSLDLEEMDPMEFSGDTNLLGTNRIKSLRFGIEQGLLNAKTEKERLQQLVLWFNEQAPNVQNLSLENISIHSENRFEFLSSCSTQFRSLKDLRVGRWCTEQLRAGLISEDVVEREIRRRNKHKTQSKEETDRVFTLPSVCMFQGLEILRIRATKSDADWVGGNSDSTSEDDSISEGDSTDSSSEYDSNPSTDSDSLYDESEDDDDHDGDPIVITPAIITHGLSKLTNLKTLFLEGQRNAIQVPDQELLRQYIPHVRVSRVY